MPPINKSNKPKAPTTVYRVHNSTPVVRTGRLMQLEGMFDLPAARTSEFTLTAELPLETREWRVGLIVGPSGSGKSSLARTVWPGRVATGYEWPGDRSIVDAMPQSLPIRSVAAILSSVGFSSPPAWQRPYGALSNGEQWRATLARSIAEATVWSNERKKIEPTTTPVIVIDEFSSVVDRTVAKIGSAAVSKAIRSTDLRFVAVTCHYDVESWLQPDWVFDTADARFRWRSLHHFGYHPPIRIDVRPAKRSEWNGFRRHHYLSETLNATAKCYVGEVEGRPAVFTAVRSFPHATRPGWTEHRTVCLPDFQGVGIGNAMSELIAAMFKATGKPYRSTTSHPAMIRHRAKSPLWSMVRAPGLVQGSAGSRGGAQAGGHGLRSFGKVGARAEYDNAGATSRLTASFEYVGPANRDAARLFGIIV